MDDDYAGDAVSSCGRGIIAIGVFMVVLALLEYNDTVSDDGALDEDGDAGLDTRTLTCSTPNSTNHMP